MRAIVYVIAGVSELVVWWLIACRRLDPFDWRLVSEQCVIQVERQVEL